MGVVDVFRQQSQFAQQTLRNLVQDVDDELANWKPGGRVSTIGELLLHTLTGADRAVHRLLGQPPLLVSAGFGERLGIGEGGAPLPEDETLRPVKMETVKEYMEAVFAAANRFLEQATDADLERTVEVAPGRSAPAFARYSVLCVMHLNEHAGEISCIKGLRGLRGY